MPSKIKRVAATAVITAATISAVLVGESLVKDVQFARAEEKVQLSKEKLETLNDLSSAFKTVGKAVEPSVVNIQIVKKVSGLPQQIPQMDDDLLKRFFPDRDGDGKPDLPQGGEERGTGSGVIMDVDGEDAYIVTNNHVAGGVTEINVLLADGRRITDAEVVGTDPKTDLAVVKIHAPRLIAAAWGDSDTLEKGDLICAFGSPFGYIGSMSHGIVSALNRDKVGIIGSEYAYENFIQVDAPINPGNSGGPLVNLRGQVVGINTAIASRNGGFQGIGFAIPSNQVKEIYDQIKNTGKVVRGWLGVRIEDVGASPEVARITGFEGDSGVLVRGTLPGTPAFGILEVGDVITKVAGKPIKGLSDLRERIAMTKPGTEVDFGVFRDKKDTSVTVKLGKQPESNVIQAAAQERATPKQSSASLGITIETPNADTLSTLNLPADAKGALVRSVQPQSIAAQAGMQPGDLITRIGDTDVSTADDATAAMNDADLSKGVRIDVLSRNGEQRMLIAKSGR